MERKLTEGRIEIIDYLKGVSIFLILLNHVIYNLNEIYAPFWIFQAVPLFLLIQVFHTKRAFDSGKTTFKKWFSKKSIVKLLKRIFLPFVVVQVIWTIIFVAQGQVPWGVIEGGAGPGSYYVWIYLQFWLIIPLFVFLKDKYGNKACFIIGLLLSILEEIICSLFFDNLPMHVLLYRLFAGRYLFLIPLGLFCFDFPIKMNWKRLVLSLISIVFIYIERYTDIDLTPVFYKSQWPGFHWLAFFYTAFLFVFILQWLYNVLHEKVKKVLVVFGQSSYEIYIVQMLVLGLLWHWKSDVFVLNILIGIVKLALSIVPALIYKKIKDAKCTNK